MGRNMFAVQEADNFKNVLFFQQRCVIQDGTEQRIMNGIYRASMIVVLICLGMQLATPVHMPVCFETKREQVRESATEKAAYIQEKALIERILPSFAVLPTERWRIESVAVEQPNLHLPGIFQTASFNHSPPFSL